VGDGAFKIAFAPTVIARSRTATIQVTYEIDSITHATATIPRTLCGEGVRTGARVLVIAGGVPLTTVEKMQISRITGNKNKPILNTVDVAQNLPLTTVSQTAPCSSFQYHREYGTVVNPIQLLPGSYRLTATGIVDKKRISQTVGFDVSTCDFNQNIVVILAP